MKKNRSFMKECPLLICVIVTALAACVVQLGNLYLAEEKAVQETVTTDTVTIQNKEDLIDTDSDTISGNEDFSESKPERQPIEPQFTYYEPKEVDSPYYFDVGKVALTTDYPYVTVENSYFDDAAFIGDSRTLGLFDYSGWTNADWYCDNGFCAYTWTLNGEVTFQKTGDKVNLQTALQEKTYGKIYLMIGINDCGYGNTQNFQDRLNSMLQMIQEAQPDAIIYLLANLHLSEKKEAGDKVNNNVDINAKNVAIAECADGITRFYLDYNSLFTDENGYLREDLSFDGTHLYAKEYPAWTDFIRSHAVE